MKICLSQRDRFVTTETVECDASESENQWEAVGMARWLVLTVFLVTGCAACPPADDAQKGAPPEQAAPAGEQQKKESPPPKSDPDSSSKGAAEDGLQTQGGEPGGLPEDVTRWKRLEPTLKEQLAEKYLEAGKRSYMAGNWVEAAHNFRVARMLTGEWEFMIARDNVSRKRKQLAEEAKRYYMECLWLIGARKGEPFDYARELVERTKVRIQQMRWEMERTYVEARRLYYEKEFKKSVERFERVLELIRWSPYFIDDKGYEDAAKHWIKLARIQAKAKEQFREEEKMRRIKESEEAEEVKRLQYLRAKMASMMDRARRLLARKRFEDALLLINRILEIDPTNEDATELKRHTIAESQRDRFMRNVVELGEWWRTVTTDVEAAAIPWQKALLYPPKDEWEVISQRVPPVMEEVKKQESPTEKMIRTKLETTPVEVNFRDTEFTAAIEFLRDISGLNIVMTREAREAVEGKTVNLRIVKRPVKSVLALLLQTEPSLRWLVKYDVVYITTEGAVEEDLLLEFYSVSEIVMVPPDHEAPQIALETGAPDSGGGLGDMDDEERGAGIESDMLQNLIDQVMSDAERNVGDIKYGNGILMVRKPLSAHRKIQKLLNALRRTVGIMVTVECRFIEVQDNLLEEIGVNWTGLGRPINDLTGPGAGTVDIGYHYINAQGQNELRGAMLNSFSVPTGAGFPFAVTVSGGLAVDFTYTDVFQVRAILEAVSKRQEALELYSPRLTIFNTQRSYVMAMYQEAYLKDVDINQTGLPVLQPVIGILNHGAILDVRPIVSWDKKYVLLELRPSMARDYTGVMDRPHRTVTLQGGLTTLNIELPSLTLTRMRTTVLCPDGGHVLIGGMKNMIWSQLETGVPLINDLSIVRNIFRRKHNMKVRRSQVVLARADIIILREEEKRLFGKASW